MYSHVRVSSGLRRASWLAGSELCCTIQDDCDASRSEHKRYKRPQRSTPRPEALLHRNVPA